MRVCSMSRSDTSVNIAHEPILPTQNALSTDTQAEARVFPGNVVEPLAESASIDLPASEPQPLGQQGQLSKGDATRTTHDLAISQEKAVLQELVASRQMLQQQQILTESLTEQLVSSQERIAQMERDLALLQQSYDEQQHLLKDEEANCQDLRTRLYRQQQQALQFKAALEKCLDNSPLRHKPDSSQEHYTTVVSHPLRYPIGYRSSQRVSTSVESLQAVDSASPAGRTRQGVDISVSSANRMHWHTTQHIHITSEEHEVFLEETAYPEINYPEDRPSRSPLIFQGQPVQPWSAPQSSPNSGSKHQELPTIPAATSPIQAVEVEAPRPSRETTASTHSTRSAPLDPLQPASRRKPPVRLELPTFPRH